MEYLPYPQQWRHIDGVEFAFRCFLHWIYIIYMQKAYRCFLHWIYIIKRKLINYTVAWRYELNLLAVKQYFTHSLRSFVKYCFHPSKIKPISSCHSVKPRFQSSQKLVRSSLRVLALHKLSPAARIHINFQILPNSLSCFHQAI